MQRLAFRKIFNQLSHISYLLLISFTTKFELQKSNYFCGFNINASEKKIIPSLSLSLSLERNFVPYPCHTTRSGFFLNFFTKALNNYKLKYGECLCTAHALRATVVNLDINYLRGGTVVKF